MSGTGGGGMWGGRFAGGADALFRAFNDSLPFDWRLVREDIEGSAAWAAALGRAGVLTGEEVGRLRAALSELAEQAASLDGAPTDSGAEDVHSWVETGLVEKVGPLGKKLHTGRSRNDQVATDLRLWTRRALDRLSAEALEVQRSLVELGEREADVPFPAYTHLQRAQPVLFAHWCLAYYEMLERDRRRMADARRRANVCPLGAAALAGTAYPIDREALAGELGFEGVTGNSLDAVSDRDFVLETLAAASVTAVHLSRLAEDLFLYTSQEFGLVELDDGVTSGSSLMPQKKNPDALELIRGKCGRIVAAQVGLLMAVKALPLAYNKDLQEDKEPLFDACEQLSLCLRMTARVLRGLEVRRERALEAARGGHANATELADYLVARGVPFRDAHDAVGRLVRVALERGAALEDLDLAALREVSPEIGEDVYPHLTVESLLAKRDIAGGTAPGRVRKALAMARSEAFRQADGAPGT